MSTFNGGTYVSSAITENSTGGTADMCTAPSDGFSIVNVRTTGAATLQIGSTDVYIVAAASNFVFYLGPSKTLKISSNGGGGVGWSGVNYRNNPA